MMSRDLCRGYEVTPAVVAETRASRHRVSGEGEGGKKEMGGKQLRTIAMLTCYCLFSFLFPRLWFSALQGWLPRLRDTGDGALYRRRLLFRNVFRAGKKCWKRPWSRYTLDTRAAMNPSFSAFLCVVVGHNHKTHARHGTLPPFRTAATGGQTSSILFRGTTVDLGLNANKP